MCEEKADSDGLANSDFAQEAWEREALSKPLMQWTAADRFRYWMQPKRLKIQLIIGAIVMIPIFGYFFWQVFRVDP